MKKNKLIIPDSPEKNLQGKFADIYQTDIVLNKVTEIAKKVAPLRVIAAGLGVHIYTFIDILRRSHELQGAIIEGEWETFDKEWKLYEAILMCFETGKPLRSNTGDTLINNVTPMIYMARMKHWDVFWKRFTYTAFTYKQDNYSITTDSQAEPEYLKLKQQIVNRINEMGGLDTPNQVAQHSQASLVFNPKHYGHSLRMHGGSDKDGNLINPTLKRKQEKSDRKK